MKLEFHLLAIAAGLLIDLSKLVDTCLSEVEKTATAQYIVYKLQASIECIEADRVPKAA